jgi:hypothetical protein
MKIKHLVLSFGLYCLFSDLVLPQEIEWQHLSTRTGYLKSPNEGKEQTSGIVCDIDKDGVNNFVISERTRTPSIVWYRRTDKGWDRYIINANPLHI